MTNHKTRHRAGSRNAVALMGKRASIAHRMRERAAGCTISRTTRLLQRGARAVVRSAIRRDYTE